MQVFNLAMSINELIDKVDGMVWGWPRAIGIKTYNSVRQIFYALLNRIKRMSNLTVSVKLVTKNIRYENNIAMNISRYLTKSVLIALYYCIFIFIFTGNGRIHNKRGGNSSDEVCSRFIYKVGLSCFFKSLLDNAAGGGLTVCTGYYNNFYIF